MASEDSAETPTKDYSTMSGDDLTKEILVELVSADAFVRVMQEFNQETVQKAAKESVQGMAHEIKNPLGGIRGAAQLMEKELDDKSLLEYTNIIINESDRLRNFVDRMMACLLYTSPSPRD